MQSPQVLLALFDEDAIMHMYIYGIHKACVNELMQNILPEVAKDLFSFNCLTHRECNEHGAAVLRHGGDHAGVGRFELWVAADEARLIAV